MAPLQSNDLELVELLRDLIKIPSYVDETHNENDVVDFLEQWFKKNTSLEIIRQPLAGGRFNLIARNGNPDMVFLAHTDTVGPKPDAPYDPFEARVVDGVIWGLGSTDMKSGIISMLQAIKLIDQSKLNNFWIVLYADEEYDFLGMKEFVREYGHIRPKMLVSSDGSDLGFGYACRGCIELRARAYGSSGHAAKGNGTNAILNTAQALCDYQTRLQTYRDTFMGKSTMNISYIYGGTKVTGSIDANNKLSKVGQAGNVIADIVEFVIDIRPAKLELNLDEAIRVLQMTMEDHGLKLEIVNKTHDLGMWLTNPDEIREYLSIARAVTHQDKVRMDDPSLTGYIDLQMLWQATGQPSAFMFGGGLGDTAHTKDERIAISDLITTRDFFLEVLRYHTSQK